MRFIDRKVLTPPKLLFDKRADKARREIDFWIEQSRSKGGTRRPPSSEWLDEEPDFQYQVAKEFHGCCAYCESNTPFDDETRRGLIGRHRPKMLAQDEDGRTKLTAYAWLTYDWENIIWVCSVCARSKGNSFFTRSILRPIGLPLETLREIEGALILDPTFDDPTPHLRFHSDGRVSPESREGEATLRLLNLNRDDLLNRRQKALRAFAHQLISGDITTGQGVLLTGTMGNPFAHSGAVTQVVRLLLVERLSAETRVEKLAEKLNSMQSSVRQALADELLSGISPMHQLFRASPVPESYPASTATGRRTPDIRQLLNAEHPITRVEITNFKALSHIEFNLPKRLADEENSPCMLLLGENATGKSSVLEAMALAVIGATEAGELDRTIKHEDLSPRNLIHRPDPYHWDQTADAMAVKLSFLDSEHEIELTAEAGDERFWGIDHCSKVVLGYGPRRFFTSRKTRRLRAPANRVRSLFDPMDMIANPIFWLSDLDDEAFFAAARALREVLMLDVEDDFERDNDPDTPGQIYIRQGDQRVAMKDVSVGYKSVIAMVCDIIRELLYHYDNLEYACAVVFIDEIETHLHPRWKMQIMQLLRRAFPKVQFIVTTHDPLCLRGMYDGEVFVLQRSPADNVERVENLPSIKGMRAEQILTSEFFGLGSTDPETDARLIRYNRLAARIEDLSEDERAEMARLRDELDDGMVLGSTLHEQAYAEALQARVKQRNVSPTKAPSPDRAELRKTFSALFESGSR
ncbi:MAG: AAA family ATPase [Hoeflea sp.]|uniref:AAA family ATPase n=1 Tax=Hoeflea sp. TaxID=1940281 RepID=UPI0032EEBB44